MRFKLKSLEEDPHSSKNIYKENDIQFQLNNSLDQTHSTTSNGTIIQEKLQLYIERCIDKQTQHINIQKEVDWHDMVD